VFKAFGAGLPCRQKLSQPSIPLSFGDPGTILGDRFGGTMFL